VAVLDELDIESSHFLGYSMGGWVGLGIGVYSSDRFRSLIIGGMGKEESNSEASIESQCRSIEGYRKGNEAQFDEIAQGLGEVPSEIFTTLRADYMSLDLEALTALRSLNEYVGFDELLPSLALPCLFYVGERDGWYQRAKGTAEIIPNARFVSFPDLDHMVGFNRSDLVLPHVLKFLDEQEK
jgi:pimeloyl-ACP methyl ester carboxylesterase